MAEEQNNNQQNNQDQNQNQDQSQNQGDAKFSQSEVDRIVQDRINRERQKYGDYEDLIKFKQEHEKNTSLQEQKLLEEKQEYDKLKQGWGTEKDQLNQKINELNLKIQSSEITSKLQVETLKQNAYPAAVDLVKSLAKMNEDGNITIRGKDANGIDTDLTVEEGMKQFLKENPYLVKGSGQGGAGTGNPGGQGGGDQGTGEPLHVQLQNAMAVGDRKKITELKAQIRAKHSNNPVVVG